MYYITPEDYERAETNGISAQLLEQRVRVYGWDSVKASTQSIRKQQDRSEWRAVADQNGITPDAFYGRLKRGWDPELAATRPLVDQAESLRNARELRRKHPQDLADLAVQNGLSKTLFRSRVRIYGWDPLRAATQPRIDPRISGRRGKEVFLERYGNVDALIYQK